MATRQPRTAKQETSAAIQKVWDPNCRKLSSGRATEEAERSRVAGVLVGPCGEGVPWGTTQMLFSGSKHFSSKCLFPFLFPIANHIAEVIFQAASTGPLNFLLEKIHCILSLTD